jgi:CubicO group peptidase (beta-lactamase class C family)
MSSGGQAMLNASFFEALTTKTQKLVADFNIPGAALGIVFGDELWTLCLGFTDLENSLPITENTLFQTGSITKTMTATVVMHLVERGQLELDKPVVHYVGELMLESSVLKALTVRHLLTHTGGWQSDNDFSNNDTGNGEDALSRYIQMMIDLPRISLPGDTWAYSNAGFRLLGRVIEIITNTSYESAVNEIILEPLNLNDSVFFHGDVHPYPYAYGHLETKQGLKRLKREFLPRNAAPAGGLCSTLNNLMVYARFQLDLMPENVYRVVISRSTLQQMHAPSPIKTRAVMPGFGEGNMGLGWFAFDVNGLRCIAHGGMTGGFLTSFWFVPDLKFAVTFLTNSRSKSAHSELTAWIRQNIVPSSFLASS